MCNVRISCISYLPFAVFSWGFAICVTIKIYLYEPSAYTKMPVTTRLSVLYQKVIDANYTLISRSKELGYKIFQQNNLKKVTIHNVGVSQRINKLYWRWLNIILMPIVITNLLACLYLSVELNNFILLSGENKAAK